MAGAARAAGGLLLIPAHAPVGFAEPLQTLRLALSEQVRVATHGGGKDKKSDERKQVHEPVRVIWRVAPLRGGYYEGAAPIVSAGSGGREGIMRRRALPARAFPPAYRLRVPERVS
jgi:hypothetical protein